MKTPSYYQKFYAIKYLNKRKTDTDVLFHKTRMEMHEYRDKIDNLLNKCNEDRFDIYKNGKEFMVTFTGDNTFFLGPFVLYRENVTIEKALQWIWPFAIGALYE